MSNIGKKPIYLPGNIHLKKFNNFLIIMNNQTGLNLKIALKSLKLILSHEMTSNDRLVQSSQPVSNKILYICPVQFTKFGIHSSILQRMLKTTSKQTKTLKQNWGTSRAIIQNTVLGLYKNHVNKLKFIGVGYKASLFTFHSTKNPIDFKQTLVLRLGFSHKIFCTLPKSINITKIKKRPPTFLLKSIDLDIIRCTSFLIRSFKKPEPYKGKGILFQNEYIKLKEGKKTK